MNNVQLQPRRSLSVAVSIQSPGLPDAHLSLRAKTGFVARLQMAHTGPAGEPLGLSDLPGQAAYRDPLGKLAVTNVLGTECPTDFLSIYQLSK